MYSNISRDIWTAFDACGSQPAYRRRHPGMWGVPYSHINTWLNRSSEASPSHVVLCILFKTRQLFLKFFKLF